MFPLKIQNQIKHVNKIKNSQITLYHREVISSIQLGNKTLYFPDDRWMCIYLGSGEEKAVFCICDHQGCVFALEIIDEKHYMNGRLIEGEYFFEQRIQGVTNVQLNPGSLMGLSFTGLVKAREFIYGYEWSRFQFTPDKYTPLDPLVTYILQSASMAKFKAYQHLYQDVHERNVMFEIRGHRERGFPMLVRDWHGRTIMANIGIRAIDVR
jgi:hypothetical protein